MHLALWALICVKHEGIELLPAQGHFYSSGGLMM